MAAPQFVTFGASDKPAQVIAEYDGRITRNMA
jgi:hypothetical protein